MFYHQRCLCEREQKDQGDDAPDLERDPGRGRGCAPHSFIDRGQAEEKQTPANSEFLPALFVEFERLGENIFDEQAVEGEATQKHRAEKSIKHSGFHFYKNVIPEIKRQPTEDHHQHGGDQRHRRQPALEEIAQREGDQHGGDEGGRGSENSQIFEGCKKNQQRPEIKSQSPQLRVHAALPEVSAPTSALAKSWATKGCRSSSPSPT